MEDKKIQLNPGRRDVMFPRLMQIFHISQREEGANLTAKAAYHLHESPYDEDFRYVHTILKIQVVDCPTTLVLL